MHIQKIELESYGPFFGRHEFVFQDRGLTLIMGDNQDEPRMDSNGAGKSSILDGLDFCLFGKIPRQDNVDSIINDEAKSCSVCVYLIDDLGREVMVWRERSKTTALQLHVDGVLFESLDIKETQKEVEAVLGVDREVFHAAVLFAQTDLVHYAESGDAERMSILTKILQLDEIDKWLEATKALDKKLQQASRDLAVKIDSKNQMRTRLLEQDFESNIQSWEESRQARLAGLHQLIENNVIARRRYAQEVDNTIPINQFTIDDMRKSLAELLPPDYSALRSAINAAQELDVELSKRVDQYRIGADELALWRQKGEGICSACGQIVTTEHLHKEIRAKEVALQSLQIVINELNRELTRARSIVGGQQVDYDTRLAAHQKEVQKRTYDIGVFEQKLASVRETESRINALDMEVRRLDMMYAEVQNEINPWVKQREENKKEIQVLLGELTRLETRQEQLFDDLEYVEFWLKAFGPKGLKSYILDARLQELTDAVNQWVTVLTGGTIWVQFSTQKKTRAQKLVNSPTVRICRWNPDGTITERNFNSWSGGEKQRISFAIDFGLSRLIAQRARKTYNLLILDEVFRHLDRGGKEAVMEMLQLLAQEKSSVFVVEHDTEFQSAFENRVLVQKKNRRSVIKELSYDSNVANAAEKTSTEAKRKALPVETVGRKRITRTPF